VIEGPLDVQGQHGNELLFCAKQADHFHCKVNCLLSAAVLPEAELAHMEEVLCLQVALQSLLDNPLEDLSNGGKEGYWPVSVWASRVLSILRQEHHPSLFPGEGEVPSCKAIGVQTRQHQWMGEV